MRRVLKSTSRRTSEGGFVVKLPFKEDSKPLGDSYHQAKRRLRNLAIRLQKQLGLYNRYSQFIQEFIQLGHIEEVPRNKIHMPATICFYLSHHCVIKDASSTIKLRVVFEASAKTASGVSLNDRLMVGHQVQKGSLWNSESFSVPSSSTTCRHCQDEEKFSLTMKTRIFTGFCGKIQMKQR